MMDKTRFRVRLIRPVFQYVDVEVDAGEENEVLFNTLAGAETAPDEGYLRPVGEVCVVSERVASQGHSIAAAKEGGVGTDLH